MFLSISSLILLSLPFTGLAEGSGVLEREREQEVKTNVGHYAALEGSAKLDEVTFLDEPAIRGVNIRYSWAKLEPEKGKYDFSQIHQDLKKLARHNKQLVVFLTDKTFRPGAMALPDYMMQDYALPGKKGGISPKRWDDGFVERVLALMEAMGKELDTHPNLEGVAFQETALSVNEDELQKAGYTPEAYRDALKAQLIGSSKAFPHTRIFWYQNFIPGEPSYLEEVIKAVAPYHVALGGPDILPYRTSLHELSSLYRRYSDKMVLFCSAQPDSYRHHKDDLSMVGVEEYRGGLKPIHKDGYVPMEQIFEYGRDTLRLNYIFWSHIEKPSKSYPGDPISNDFDDALRVIRQNPAFNEQ